MESNKTAAPSNKLIIAIVALIVVIIGAAGVVVYALNNQEADVPDNDGLTIGYASGSNVFLDEESLQAAMDQAIANDTSVSLRYQNDAISTDGVNFECYITNSPANRYDMFLTICADPAMEDIIFLSQLLRPGSGFEKITLNRALESGTHTVYVAVTLVDTQEDNTQVIKGQAVHTMDFHVS